MKKTVFLILLAPLLLAGCASTGSTTTNPQMTSANYGPYTQSPFYPQTGPGGGGGAP
jgi:nitrous oxide reductase accessory protein NosL